MITEKTVIEINKNRYGIAMVRENGKKRAVVKVKSLNGKDNIAKYRFKNIDLNYKTKYMNWQNLDHCGGWIHSSEDLLNQFINDKKLLAEVDLFAPNKEESNLIKDIEEKMQSGVYNIKEVPHFNNNCRMFVLCKQGCVADYIDVDKVIEEYYRLGLQKLTEKELELLNCMMNTPIESYVSKDANKFKYDFGNPIGLVELIFGGMLLGYPIESTASLLGL